MAMQTGFADYLKTMKSVVHQPRVESSAPLTKNVRVALAVSKYSWLHYEPKSHIGQNHMAM